MCQYGCLKQQRETRAGGGRGLKTCSRRTQQSKTADGAPCIPCGQRGRQRADDISQPANLAPGAWSAWVENGCLAGGWATTWQQVGVPMADLGSLNPTQPCHSLHSVATKTTFSPWARPGCARQVVDTVAARLARLGPQRQRAAQLPLWAAAAAAAAGCGRPSSPRGSGWCLRHTNVVGNAAQV